MILQIPRDAVANNSMSVVANLSVGSTTGNAVLYTTIEVLDEASETSVSHETLIAAGTTTQRKVLLPKLQIPNAAGSRCKVTITRKVGTGEDDLYFSSVRLHTLQVTYERNSVPKQQKVKSHKRNSDSKRVSMDSGLD